MKIGIIGCGVISSTYIHDIQNYYSDDLQLGFVADIDVSRAKARAEEFSVPAFGSVEDLLADRETELVINLTPPLFHIDIDRKIILAGKHVYSEKPFALSLKDAQEIAELAEQNGVKIAGAPDTYLSAHIDNAVRLVKEGWIGRPLYATANMLNHGMELWHPAPDAFYRWGAGPVFDMGGYYIAPLTAMFGSVKSIIARGSIGNPVRTIGCGPRKGEDVKVETPTTYMCILQMESGVTVSLTFSFDVWKNTLPFMEIYGTDGTLNISDPNMTDGQCRIFRRETVESCEKPGPDIRNDYGAFSVMPNRTRALGQYTRGAGVVEMVRAIEAGRPVKTAFCIHITEALCGIISAAETGREYVMQTSL